MIHPWVSAGYTQGGYSPGCYCCFRLDGVVWAEVSLKGRRGPTVRYNQYLHKPLYSTDFYYYD